MKALERVLFYIFLQITLKSLCHCATIIVSFTDEGTKPEKMRNPDRENGGKQMKRIFTISVAAVMALLMVLSLTACGNSTLGYYKLTSAEASGMSFDSSTLAAVGMDKGYILLKEDGKAKLSAAGQEQDLTYDDKNFTAGSESIPYTLKDGVITMEKDGTKLVFTFDANFKPESSNSESSK